MKKWLILILNLCLSTSYSEGVTFAKRLLWINSVELQVEVAATQEQRARGLMYRQELPEGYGMLFVFTGEETPCFWMKNTIIPLSLAYISRQGQIVQLEDLEPQSEQLICAKTGIRYALEVPKGWFEKHNIKLGDYIKSGQ